MLRRAPFVVVALATFLASGCASHSSAVPTTVANGVDPFVNQTGNQNGWLTFSLQLGVPLGNAATGHDGGIWTANYAAGGGADQVIRLSLAGIETAYPATPGLTGFVITANPDGNMYIGEGDQSRDMSVAQVTPQGSIAYFPLSGQGIIGTIESASDANLWMTGSSGGGNFIAKMTTSGVVTIVNGQAPCSPHALVRGPDKNLWADCGSNFARISVPDGSVTLFPAIGTLESVVEGSDGGVWGWARGRTGGFERIDMLGNVTDYPMSVPSAMVAGPNHKLYWGNAHTQRIDTFSEISRKRAGSIALPPGADGMIVIGPDAQLWLVGDSGHAYAYVLHEIVVTPSPIVVQQKASAPVAVIEKGSPQHAFSAVSNNPAIASVSGTGESFTVTGVSPGNTTITFSDQIGNSLDVPVTVQ